MIALAAESALFAAILALFVAWAIVFTKPEHLAGNAKWRVVAGAAIEGVIVGAILGYVLLPGWISFTPLALRPTEEVLALKSQMVLAPAFLVEEIVRNGGLTNVPGFSYFLRPRRRAILLRRKSALEEGLAKLDAALAGTGSVSAV